MKKVTIIGAGALGSHLVLLLRNLAAELRVVDFDRVEQKNVLSQFHAKTHVGKLKVQALQQTMQFLFNRKVEVVGNKLTAENTSQLLGGSNLIIDCVDNTDARKIIQDFARLTDTPCVHGGLAAGGVYGIVIWDEHFKVATAENDGSAATCEDGEFLPHIAAVSAFLAEAVKQFITDGKKYGYSVSAGHMSRV